MDKREARPVQTPQTSRAPLDRAREALDRALLGQEDAKTGLLLALVAREHAYLEGPPGCGKSALAAALPRIAGARSARISFHRDTGASELLGEHHLRRERRETSERISFERMPGALAHAEILLLDQKFMAGALVRLPLWERGLVWEAVLRAAKAKHPSKAQRALLALFLTNDPNAHGGDDVSA